MGKLRHRTIVHLAHENTATINREGASAPLTLKSSVPAKNIPASTPLWLVWGGSPLSDSYPLRRGRQVGYSHSQMIDGKPAAYCGQLEIGYI